jgi:hypothetical protein
MTTTRIIARLVGAAALALALAVTIPGAAAAGRGADTAGPSRAAATSEPAGWIARLWGSLASLWSEVGCTPDPDGRCGTGQGTTPSAAAAGGTTDVGCTPDPNGGCGGALPK